LAANAANAVALSIGVSPLNPAIKGGEKSKLGFDFAVGRREKRRKNSPLLLPPLFFFTILSRAIVPFCRSEKGGL
jgi:hypothetical protein